MKAMQENSLRSTHWGRFAVLISIFAGNLPAMAGDWPTWRFDARHSGISPGELPGELHRQWVWRLPRPRPAWPEQQDKLDFDRCYRPVAAGQRLFVSLPNDDRLLALDTRSGQLLWEFQAEGPLRFSPAVFEDRVYFVSDDGYLYCVAAADGHLVWKFRGGPSERRILGNDRLISAWPARGAPVIDDEGRVYFAASIWPFMGVFIHCLDARSGAVVWTSDGLGSLYIKQPHNTDAFASVAPQGPLVISGERLIVPGGRSIPAGFDRRTGELVYFKLAENGKQGGWDVAAGDRFFVAGDELFNLADGSSLDPMQGLVLIGSEVIVRYGSIQKKYEAFDLRQAEITTEEKVDRKGQKQTVSSWTLPELWSVEAPGGACMIQAGNRIYAGSVNRLVCLELPPLPALDATPTGEDKADEGQGPAEQPAARLVWEKSLESTPADLIAADDRLFVVLEDGSIVCLGGEPLESPREHKPPRYEPPSDAASAERIARLIEHTGASAGYAVCWGLGDGRPFLELVRRGSLYVVGLDADEARVRELRKTTVAADWYGQRTSIHQGRPGASAMPAYLASLAVAASSESTALVNDQVALAAAYDNLRPYGGVLCLDTQDFERVRAAVAKAGNALTGARVEAFDNWVLIFRDGPLPQAGSWTHEHADAANTRVSLDARVKAPLGLLWFGGPTHEGVLPRHGHGPQPQVFGGRLFIEGVDFLRAVDVYTGRLLWQRQLEGVGYFYDNFMHQPGANATNTNYITMPDGVYVVYSPGCLKLAPATGETLAEFTLPPEGEGKAPAEWGYINVVGDYLIGGANPLVTSEKKGRAAVGKPENLSASKRLVVMNRHTGTVLWQAEATHRFRHNAICAGGGRLFAVDRLPPAELEKLNRRGETPAGGSRVVCFDLATGSEVWSVDEGVFGTWLSYSAEHDVLVESGRPARDTFDEIDKKMRALAGNDGRVLWEHDYPGPAMILGDRVLYTGSACKLLTGEQVLREDPVSGAQVPWTWSRTYGCNTPMAAVNLLTFRSGAAGYFDLACDGGTGNFGGFRSGCTNNLIVADGVLSAPDYTRSCTCSYQNQTSLALVHMPEIEQWTQFDVQPAANLKHLALNLGAPGHRRAPDGRLWLREYAQATVEFDSPGPWCHHATRVSGEGWPWVGASGIRGIRRIEIDPKLDPPPAEPARFTVRLWFCDPDHERGGRRRFHVAVQDQEVLHDFDVAAEAGGRNRMISREFRGVAVTDKLVVSMTAATDAAGDGTRSPILCGLEVVREE